MENVNKLLKNDGDSLTRHHRCPRKLGGKDGDLSGNISFVKRKFHEAWHLLFNHKSAPEIAEVINEDWLDPKYRMVAMTHQEFHQFTAWLMQRKEKNNVA